jgi:hypothetical protein
MKYTIFLSCFVLFSISSKSQAVILHDSIAKADLPDSLVGPVQSGSYFVGGGKMWQRYLIMRLRYPDAAARHNIQGDVVVEFSIGESGLIGDVKAISGPKELRPSAIDVIEHGPRWNPATIREVPIKTFNRVKISFRIQSG